MIYLTRRGENALRAAAVTSVLLISGTALLILSAIGEDRRCAHLTATPHAAADTYGCTSTTTGTAGAGEGPAVPVVTRSTAAVVAPQPKPSKASRKRATPPTASGSPTDTTCYVWTGNRTASGKWPTVGTAASNRHPFGTRLHVEGVGVVTVEDRIGHSSELDLFYGDRADCLRFGRQTLRVTVLR